MSFNANTNFSSNVSYSFFWLTRSTFNLPLVCASCFSNNQTIQWSNQPQKKNPFKELNLLKLCMHLNCSQQILTAVLNGKDNKNAQHRKDLSECLHTPDAQTCTDMWFTNVEVLRVEYKIYFSSTQNVLLVFVLFQTLLPFYLLQLHTSLTSRRQTTSARYLIKITQLVVLTWPFSFSNIQPSRREHLNLGRIL